MGTQELQLSAMRGPTARSRQPFPLSAADDMIAWSSNVLFIQPKLVLRLFEDHHGFVHVGIVHVGLRALHSFHAKAGSIWKRAFYAMQIGSRVGGIALISCERGVDGKGRLEAFSCTR